MHATSCPISADSGSYLTYEAFLLLVGWHRDSLADETQSTERPIIFVGHSLGGIVIKSVRRPVGYRRQMNPSHPYRPLFIPMPPAKAL